MQNRNMERDRHSRMYLLGDRCGSGEDSSNSANLEEHNLRTPVVAKIHVVERAT
jgi:hypothetical protein